MKRKNFKLKMSCTLLFAASMQMALALAPNKPVEAMDYVAEHSQKSAAVVNTTNAADETSLGGTFATGDYLAYQSLDFGDGGYKKFMLVLSANTENEGKIIEVRLDNPTGTKVGEITLTDTKGPQIFKEHYADITAITGVHDVYLVFPESVNVDLDFFLFTTYMFTPYAGTDSGVYYNTGGLAITETKDEKTARMKWWNDSRYGMFIHFGSFSYLGGRTLNSTTGAFTGTVLNSQVEWIMKRMAPADAFPKEIYRQYSSAMLNPQDFDAKGIVELAKNAGMKYITITSRHHEGFSMYDTKIRNFKDYKITNIANNGNFNRDLIKELADECRAQGIHFTAYVSLVDWYDKTMYPIYGTKGGFNSADATAGFNGSTVEERSVNKADYLSRLKGQLKELIVDYGAEAIWFDCGGMFDMTHDESYELYHYIHSLNPKLISNNRIFTDRIGTTRTATDLDFFTPEQSALTEKADFNFELCQTLNNNWGYAINDNNWKSPADVVNQLVQSSGFGGNLLLNVGPDGNGNIPDKSAAILSEVGNWLKTIGNSIYETVPAFYETKELPGGVYTTAKAGKLFIHLLPSYKASTIMLDMLENTITNARVLNNDQAITTYTVNGKLLINLSGVARDPYDTVVEIDVDGGMPQRKESSEPAVLTNIAKYMNDQGKLTLTGSNTYRRSTETTADPKDPDLVFGYKKAFDENDGQIGGFDSRWAAADEVTAGEMILTFAEPVTVNKAMVEAFAQGTMGGSGSNTNWIRALDIEYWDGTDWVVAASHSGTYLENKEKKEFVFDAFTTTKVRLNITEALKPSIWEFQLFYDPAAVVVGVDITSPAANVKIDKGNFTVSGTYTGDADGIDIDLSAAELLTPISIPGVLNTEEKTWSTEINQAETGLPDYVENLSLLALLKKGDEYIAANTVLVTYGGYENLALGKTATASSMFNANYGPEKAVDGINSEPTNRWASLANDAKPYLIVDFGEATTFNKAIIYEYKGSVSTGLADGYRSTGFKIWYDQGDDNWVLAYTGTQIGAKGEFMFSKPETAKRVKLELTDYPFTGYQPSILEFEIYLVSTDLNIPAVNTAKNFFILYPNPVKKGEQIQIKTSINLKNIDIEVFDAIGNLCLKTNQPVIDTSKLKQGIYIVELNGNTEKYISKIVIN